MYLDSLEAQIIVRTVRVHQSIDSLAEDRGGTDTGAVAQLFQEAGHVVADDGEPRVHGGDTPGRCFSSSGVPTASKLLM